MDYKKNKAALQKQYWDSKYNIDDIGWDLGSVSPPIRDYANQLVAKDLKILIPGAGNSYEAEYLFKKGFSDVTVLDISKQPLINLKSRIPEFPDQKLIYADFWEHSSKYDLILEQTFFCAIHPDLRVEYVKKMHGLLRSGGKLAGLLFQFELTEQGPPFGGSKLEYESLFKELFRIKVLETSYNSVKPRMENELFFIFEKK